MRKLSDHVDEGLGPSSSTCIADCPDGPAVAAGAVVNAVDEVDGKFTTGGGTGVIDVGAMTTGLLCPVGQGPLASGSILCRRLRFRIA